MFVVGRFCCKSPKRRSGQFLAEERNKRESPINRAPNALPESSVSLALGDVVPHIIIQSLHLRARDFEAYLAKRLLQQNRHQTDAAGLADDVCSRGSKPDRRRRSRFASRAGLEPFAVCMERLLFALVFSHGSRSNSRRGWSQDGVARQWSFATAAERSTTMRKRFSSTHRPTNQMRRRSGVPSARRRDSGDCCARR